MGPQTITASDGTVLDAGVVNLSKAIRQRESGGNYNAVGDAGTSHGAYQWQPGNYEAGAKMAGIDPKDFSPVSQDKVAYYQVKALKDKGYTPEQVAAAWNAGEGSLQNDKWKSNVGDTVINGQKVHYDTPGYVNSVIQNFNQYKGQNSYNPKPFSSGAVNIGSIDLSGNKPTETAPAETGPSIIPNYGEIQRGLSTGLTNRVNDFGGALQPLMKGDVASSGLQAVGAVAGGVGDVTNAALELIPGVQGAEKLLGSGIKALASTDVGKSVVSAFQSFAQQNPTVAKDIGAGINILAAIPLLHGISSLSSAVLDTGTLAFKDTVENAAMQEIKGNLTKVPAAAAERAAARGVDPIETMVKTPTYLPEVVRNPSGGFMYDSSKARSAIDGSLNADEAALQAKLDQAITDSNTMVSITQAEKQVLKDIQNQYRMSGNYLPAARAVADYFESIKASSGGRDMISLNELNGLKRDVRNAVFDVKGDIRGSASAQIKYEIGQSLMDQVEAMAKKVGIDGVPELNKEMSKKLEVLKVLDAMDGRKVATKGGLGREAVSDAAMVGGEMAGNAFGLPFAGTLAGRGLVGKLLNRIPRTPTRKLKTLSPNVLSTSKQGLKQLGKGVLGQGLANKTRVQ